MKGDGFLRRLFLFAIILLISYSSWSAYGKPSSYSEIKTALITIKDDLDSLKKNENITDFFQSLDMRMISLVQQLETKTDKLSKDQPEILFSVEKPKLKAPDKQAFSIYNIELGDLRRDVEKQIGKPKRESFNEYGVKWYAYHENYQNFMMVAYNKKGKVAALYTNNDLVTSTKGISLGTEKDKVLNILGEPLSKIQKGLIYYQFQQNRDYDMFRLVGSYVTVFYDKHEDNTVTAIQIVDEHLEANKREFYTKASTKLKEGFEFQLFDLTNATRVKHQLGILNWDEHVKMTARRHSNDMAENNYFDHKNLKGQSPFDRMTEDNIIFTLAGENLATGQFSSIFAHEGLMNSLGHRKNILKPGFENLGVGVAFNSKSQPYYTQKYFTK
ncbi:CAP domain-containing protein (plasmid) [Bacillus sp. 31A1R]|uniref:CAP domain-containing protein n=1 Tax=Robertmurraya mangrovi TaxID=3098077 RepID=A0ABU5IUD2_9BACI|nr:CAP domain-containing protein [Bacillus sp. 31A1R]MDZ5470760.1 CAP domain-containing protein [Bacillus sp. 31A1R]